MLCALCFGFCGLLCAKLLKFSQDTPIIPGLMLTFLSELPEKANGSTLVRMYLAARSCMAQNANNGVVDRDICDVRGTVFIYMVRGTTLFIARRSHTFEFK